MAIIRKIGCGLDSAGTVRVQGRAFGNTAKNFRSAAQLSMSQKKLFTTELYTGKSTLRIDSRVGFLQETYRSWRSQNLSSSRYVTIPLLVLIHNYPVTRLHQLPGPFLCKSYSSFVLRSVFLPIHPLSSKTPCFPPTPTHIQTHGVQRKQILFPLNQPFLLPLSSFHFHFAFFFFFISFF